MTPKLYRYQEHGHSCTTELLPDHVYCAACYPGEEAMAYIASKKKSNDEAKKKIKELDEKNR